MDQPRNESVHARVGSVLRDKWALGEVIGSGGTAAVYEGTHRTNGRRVAVKIMHAHLASSEDVVSRFQREGYIANKVGHPGAVTILDDDRTEDGAPFLVMDRLDGAPLTKLLEAKRSGLELGPALRIVHEVLDILVAAHAQGITHRDIKPDNVFLTVSGRVMLLDFGIARLREHLIESSGAMQQKTVKMAAKTQEGLTLGTPLYMSPEQARGRWSEVDARSDLWSVGAIMFRLLTGRPLRTATNPADMLLQAVSESAPRMADVAPSIPPDVAGIVDRALEYEKVDRWPDAKSMQKAVRDAATRVSASRARPLSVPPGAQDTPPPIPTPPRSRRTLFAIAGLVLAALVALAYTPHSTHSPATATATPTATPTPTPTAAATAIPAADPSSSLPSPPAPLTVDTVNVEDLPSAPLVVTEPNQPPRPVLLHPHHRLSPPLPSTSAPPPPDPAPSVLDRRH